MKATGIVRRIDSPVIIVFGQSTLPAPLTIILSPSIVVVDISSLYALYLCATTSPSVFTPKEVEENVQSEYT